MRDLRKYTPDEDAPLLASWYRGDTNSFETLVRKYQKRIFNISFLITGDYECAAAAVQSACVIAYFDARNLLSTTHFSSWLIGLVIRESRNLLELGEAVKSAAAPPQEGLADKGSSDAGKYEDSLLLDRLRDCIKSLPVGLVEVLVLRYVRGYNIEKVSEILQLREDVIIGRLFEAEESTIHCIRHTDASTRDSMMGGVAHPEIRRNFSAYLDNSFEREESVAEIKRHLMICGSCRESLAELEWIVEHLKSIPDVDPPIRLIPDIIASIRSGTPPVKPAANRRQTLAAKPVIRILLAFAVPVLLLSAWYLLNQGGENWQVTSVLTIPGRERALPKPAETPDAAKPYGSITFMPSPSQRSVPAKPEAVRETLPQKPLPLPAAPLPESHPVSPPVQPQQLQKKSAPDQTPVKNTAPELPAEWGEDIRLDRLPPKKPAAREARNSGELSLLLSTTDPMAAAAAIERGVTELGGKIYGRAYSGGNDILYTKIGVERFPDLMKRLKNIGKIQELPHPPDGAEGTIDLIIKWH